MENLQDAKVYLSVFGKTAEGIEVKYNPDGFITVQQAIFFLRKICPDVKLFDDKLTPKNEQS